MAQGLRGRLVNQMKRQKGAIAGRGPGAGRPGAAVMPRGRGITPAIAAADVQGGSGAGEGRGVGGRRREPAEAAAVQPGTAPATPEATAAAVETPANIAPPTPGIEAPMPAEAVTTGPNRGMVAPRGVQDAGAGAGGFPMAQGLRNRFEARAQPGQGPGLAGFGMVPPGQTGGMQGPGGRQMLGQYMRGRRGMPEVAPKRRKSRFFTGA